LRNLDQLEGILFLKHVWGILNKIIFVAYMGLISTIYQVPIEQDMHAIVFYV